MAKTVLITPRDPLIFRDGRPFGSSLTTRLHVHTWPFPSVTAGAVRTHAGKELNSFDKATLNRIDIRGPLLYCDNTLYVPAPRDAVMVEGHGDKKELCRLLPQQLQANEGSDLPFAMWPLMLPEEKRLSKNGNEYVWWPLSLAEKWLINPGQVKAEELENQCLKELPLDERTHVAIKPDTGAADPAQLFSTRGIDFMRKKKCADRKCPEYDYCSDRKCPSRDMPFQLALRVNRADDIDFSSAIPLGAERRLAILSDEKNVPENLWNYPENIQKKLTSSQFIRLQLATPAIFNKGWYPDWLTETNDAGRLTGRVPHSDGVEVELCAAAIGRYAPISGYTYGKSKAPNDGESTQSIYVNVKATKKMVPAGSVYFFKVLQGNAAALAKELWLHPICGQSYFHPQPGKARTDLGADGFGLALWGVWQPNN